jgi:hypothetical protein
MAIAYNVSTSIFGGTAPMVTDWLIGRTGSTLVPAYYMMGACAVGAVALVFVTETVGCSLRGRGIPGAGTGAGAGTQRDDMAHDVLPEHRHA